MLYRDHKENGAADIDLSVIINRNSCLQGNQSAAEIQIEALQVILLLDNIEVSLKSTSNISNKTDKFTSKSLGKPVGK